MRVRLFWASVGALAYPAGWSIGWLIHHVGTVRLLAHEKELTHE